MGATINSQDSPALPKPVQQPHPPLIVGGGGAKRTPRLAATFADEFNLPFSSLADTEAQYARVRAACEDKGRDPETLRLSAAQTVCCGANEAEVERRAANIGRKPDELRANGVAGTPEEVVARLQEFAAIGAESIYLQVLDLDRHGPHFVALRRGAVPTVLTRASRPDHRRPPARRPIGGPGSSVRWRRPGRLADPLGGLPSDAKGG